MLVDIWGRSFSILTFIRPAFCLSNTYQPFSVIPKKHKWLYWLRQTHSYRASCCWIILNNPQKPRLTRDLKVGAFLILGDEIKKNLSWEYKYKPFLFNINPKCSPCLCSPSSSQHPQLGVREEVALVAKDQATLRLLVLEKAIAGFSWAKAKVNWLVVDLPLWKIWVCQMGWWHSQYMEKYRMFQTTNQ